MVVKRGKGGEQEEKERRKKGRRKWLVLLFLLKFTSTASSDSTSTKDSIALTMLSRIFTRESELIPHLHSIIKEVKPEKKL